MLLKYCYLVELGDVPGLEVRDSFIELDDAGLDVADELGSLFFLGRLGSFGRPRFFAGLKKMLGPKRF